MLSQETQNLIRPTTTERSASRKSLAGSILLGTGLVILLLVTATPVYVYYADPWDVTGSNLNVRQLLQ